MQQQFQALFESIALQNTKFVIAYFIVFLAIVLNSVCIRVNSKNHKIMCSIVLLIENIFLSIALLLYCIIHVLIVDAIGQDFYRDYSVITNICLLAFFFSIFLCLANLFTVIFYNVKHKNC